MQKNTIISIVVFVIFVGGIVFYVSTGNAAGMPATPEVSAPSATPPLAASTSTPTSTTYTLTQVQTHNSAQSCWSAVGGKVYDLTSWINSHPGGKEAILSICGKDGTQAFMDKHGDNQKVANVLVGFEVGLLVQ